MKWILVKAGWFGSRGGWTTDINQALKIDSLYEANQLAVKYNADLALYDFNQP